MALDDDTAQPPLAREMPLPARACVLLAPVLYGALPFVLGRASGPRTLAVASVVLVIVAALVRDATALSVTLLFTLMMGWIATGAPPFWPFYLLVPLVAWSLPLISAPRLRDEVRAWLQRGRIDRATAAWMAATVVVSSGALSAWLRLARPDVSDLRGMMPHGGAGVMVGAALGFAVVNAVMEEAVWRGVLMSGLQRAVAQTSPLARSAGGEVRAAVGLVVGLQAVSFGVAHAHGFPRGVVGMAMAGVYGAMLGWVRLRSAGMLAPVVTHVAADATIFALLASRMGEP